jgi:hypothetical protein
MECLSDENRNRQGYSRKCLSELTQGYQATECLWGPCTHTYKTLEIANLRKSWLTSFSFKSCKYATRSLKLLVNIHCTAST